MSSHKKNRKGVFLSVGLICLFVISMIPQSSAYTVGQVVNTKSFSGNVKGVCSSYEDNAYVRFSYLAYPNEQDGISQLQLSTFTIGLTGYSHFYYTNGVGAITITPENLFFIAGESDRIFGAIHRLPATHLLAVSNSGYGIQNTQQLKDASYSNYQNYITETVYLGDKIASILYSPIYGSIYNVLLSNIPSGILDSSKKVAWGTTQPHLLKLNNNFFAVYDTTNGLKIYEKSKFQDVIDFGISYPNIIMKSAFLGSGTDIIFSNNSGIGVYDYATYVPTLKNSNIEAKNIDKLYYGGSYIYGIKGTDIHIFYADNYTLKETIHLSGIISTISCSDITKDLNFMLIGYSKSISMISLTGIETLNGSITFVSPPTAWDEVGRYYGWVDGTFGAMVGLIIIGLCFVMGALLDTVANTRASIATFWFAGMGSLISVYIKALPVEIGIFTGMIILYLLIKPGSGGR